MDIFKFQAISLLNARCHALTAVFVLILAMGAVENVHAEETDAKRCKFEFENIRESAYSTCQSPAEAGDKDAQKAMGDMLYSGWGKQVNKNFSEALLWYKRAANSGNIEAKYNAGVMYEQGQGTAADMERAYKWYRSAAEQGHMMAQFNLANMISKGMGVARNNQEAFRWYLRAAEQGDPEAAFNVANHYAKGVGVEQNVFEAYKWYEIANIRGMKDTLENQEHLSKHISSGEVLAAKAAAQKWQPKTETYNAQ